ncbi:MAG: spore peptidogylcan hydrolase [Clostridiales bacterium]|jgi:spore germination protein|nr:spore peptidogylcan hydrolase [Clostridiales bacterium]
MLIHVVTPGDNLTSIARTYDVTTDSLVENNGLTATDTLVVGQAIIIISPNFPTTKLGTLQVNGYAYPNIDRAVLTSALPYLTYLSIFSYGITPEGDLLPAEDTELLQIAAENNVAPLLVLTTITEDGSFSSENAGLLLNNVEAQNNLVDNLIEVMQAKNYRGLDIDFEFVPSTDRQAYIDFVTKLNAALTPLGYLVSVALAPKTSAMQTGLLYEAHDYAALGNAADEVLIMTYEWGYTYGPPMAVAPLNKVNEVLLFATSQIAPAKISMGVPNYGYDWTLPYTKGVAAQSIGNVEAIDIARENTAVIEFDSVAQAPFFNYFSEGNNHVVWFEDARSIEAKLKLANGFNLNGIGIWNIMRAFPQLWVITSAYYNIKKV